MDPERKPAGKAQSSQSIVSSVQQQKQDGLSVSTGSIPVLMPCTIPEIVATFRTPKRRFSHMDVQNRLRFRQQIIASALDHELFDRVETALQRIERLEMQVHSLKSSVSVRDFRDTGLRVAGRAA